MQEAVYTLALISILLFILGTLYHPPCSVVASPSNQLKGGATGPFPLSLALLNCAQLISELCVMFLDDVTLAGATEDILLDLEMIMTSQR